LTADLLTVAVSYELCLIHPTHVPIFSILLVSVPELLRAWYSITREMQFTGRWRWVMGDSICSHYH